MLPSQTLYCYYIKTDQSGTSERVVILHKMGSVWYVVATSLSLSRHFFELLRFDFVLDEELTVWLMEVGHTWQQEALPMYSPHGPHYIIVLIITSCRPSLWRWSILLILPSRSPALCWLWREWTQIELVIPLANLISRSPSPIPSVLYAVWDWIGQWGTRLTHLVCTVHPKCSICTSVVPNPDLLSPYHHGRGKGEGTSLATIMQKKEKDTVCSMTILVTDSLFLSITGELVPQSLLQPHPQESSHVWAGEP